MTHVDCNNSNFGSEIFSTLCSFLSSRILILVTVMIVACILYSLNLCILREMAVDEPSCVSRCLVDALLYTSYVVPGFLWCLYLPEGGISKMIGCYG